MSISSAGSGTTPSPESATAAPAPRLSHAPDLAGAPPDPRAAPPADEEVDVWWGSYSLWTLLPGFLLTFLLTALAGWGAWLVVTRGWIEVTFLGLAFLIWTVQLGRWCHRAFGFNYRLTNRRLFRDYGVLRPGTIRVNLADVAHVSVRKVGLVRLLGVGQVRILLEDKSQVVLEGLREPGHVVGLIRTWVEKARAAKTIP